MDASDWINLVGTLAATFIGAWLGYLLATKQERIRDARLYESMRLALRAEIERCGELANTYISEGILAPAYRFSSSAYEVTFPHLVASGRLGPQDVRALIDFRSQVQQANWCLDQIHDHLQTHFGDAGAERGRLIAKLQEMRAPESRFYTPAMEALRAK